MNHFNYFAPIAAASILSSALLVALHILLWHQPWRLSRVASYSVGVTTILFASLIWALLTPDVVHPLIAVAAFAAIAVSSGGCVVVAYWLRDCLSIIHHNAEARKHARAQFRAALGETHGDPREARNTTPPNQSR